MERRPATCFQAPRADIHTVGAQSRFNDLPTPVRRVLIIALILFGTPCLTAQSWERSGPILPAPAPFTLNSYDVIHAVLMIRQEPALLRVGEDGSRTIVPVRSARSVWVDFNPDAYENHQNRYDVELNGEPLDWDHLFIEYDGSMVNLRLLFTYRNQQPVPEVRYRVE